MSNSKNLSTVLSQQHISMNNNNSSFLETKQSICLIFNSIYHLFSKKGFKRHSQLLFSVEPSQTLIKKNIVYFTRIQNFQKILTYLQSLNKEQFENLPQEFFYLTAQKFSQQQTIQNYSEFLYIITRMYDFDGQFVNRFFYQERDANEVFELIQCVQKWDQNQLKENKDEIIKIINLIALESFCQQNNHGEFFKFYKLFKDKILTQNKQQILMKLFDNFIFSLVNKGHTIQTFQKSLKFFLQEDLIFNEELIKKALFILKKNEEFDYFTSFYEFCEEQNIITTDIINLFLNHCLMVKSIQKMKQIIEKDITLNAQSFQYIFKCLKNNQDTQNFDFFEQMYLKNEEFINYDNESERLKIITLFNDQEKLQNFYEKLKNENKIEIDENLFYLLVKSSISQKNIILVEYFLKEIKEQKQIPSKILFNMIVDFYVKQQQMIKAFEIIGQMQKNKIQPDNYTYSIIINGLKINQVKQQLAENTLKNLVRIINKEQFPLDEVIFNSIFDICSHYNFLELFEEYFKLMQTKEIQFNQITYSFCVKIYAENGMLQKSYEFLELMIKKNMPISDMIYGTILNNCTKNDNMEIALKLFETLKKSEININSIVFTTILKGFVRTQKYDKAIQFFQQIKINKQMPGMIITFNCALDAMVLSNRIDDAKILFQEIDDIFEADLISYSTIIKGLCSNNKKREAFEYLKKMLKREKINDVSVLNLFLESTSSRQDFRMGIEAFKLGMESNLKPNEITFGIMVKLYGFAKELKLAFDLMDQIKFHRIIPSIIFYTNLIHISFYNADPRKAELAFILFKKQQMKGDSLMYSKLIDGLMKFKQFNKVPKYIQFALDDQSSLKPRTFELLKKHYHSQQILNQIELLEGNQKYDKRINKTERNNNFKNHYNFENPKKFKALIREKKRQELQTIQEQQAIKQKQDQKRSNEIQRKQKPQKIELFNFRLKRVI